jgi:OOP family OmpA-OmpF porin
MKQSFRVAMLAATSLLFAGAASAQSSSIYTSLYLGGGKANLDCSDTTSCKDSSTTGRVALGYSFTPFVSAEASYSALGSYTATADDEKAKLRARAFGLGMGFRMPFGAKNQWAATARVGVSFARLNATLSDRTGRLDAGQSSRRLYAGVGATYALSQAVDLGVAFDRTNAGFFGSNARFASLSGGVTYKF